MLENFANLYQELIIEHSRNPRNTGVLPDQVGQKILGINASCGDKLLLSLHIEDGLIQQIQHQSSGCAIFLATSSLMSSIVQGRKQEYAVSIIQLFLEKILNTEQNFSQEEQDVLGKLLVFSNVSQYPARVKCASLFPRTLEYLITHYNNIAENDLISTE